MASILAILFLATFVEGLVQFISNEDEHQPWLRYVALAIGVVVAVAFRVDIPAMVGLAADYGVINYIVSGLILGRGSNYVNDVLSNIRGE